MLGTPFLLAMAKLGLFLGVVGYSFLGAGASAYPPGQWKTIIENKSFTQTLDLDTGDDNTLIINSTFYNINGDGITIRNAKNVYIKNCRIYNVNGNGIVLRSTGSTENVTIDGCKIYNVRFNGILAKQNEANNIDHKKLIVKNNTVYDIGTTEYDHGLYIFAKDSLIENNTVYNSAGNGISIRSSGIVRNNKIWETQESCIKYYSNHAPGPSKALHIENNVCHQTKTGSGDPGIVLRRANETPESWLVSNFYVRFNTVVMFTAERYGFTAASSELNAKRIELYGNIFINTKKSSRTFHPQYVDYLSSNYASTSLKGFANATQSPYDFQLTNSSPARRYASIEPKFPAKDIKGTSRVAGSLDAGAYQFSGSPTTGKPPKPIYLPYVFN